MESTRGRWGEVEDNVYIRDLNGKTWRVVRSTEKRVRLEDRERKTIDLLRPPGNREVTILVPTEEEARFTLAKALGARILASRTPDGRFYAPKPDVWDLDQAQWHMSRFHRVDTGDLSLEEIRQLHETSEPTCQHEHVENP